MFENNKIYYLSTCDTCIKIISSIDASTCNLQNIREQNIDKETLQALKKKIGSYEALFNKRAQKLKTMTQAERPKTENDFKRLILSDYTFMKRPIIVSDRGIFVGNEKKNLENLLAAFPKK
jgi:arsenate reductase